MRPTLVIALLTGIPLLAALPAAAQDKPAAVLVGAERDAKVVLDLKAEAWVETKTALVRAVIEAAFASGQSGAVRTQALEALQKVAPQGQWHITSFDQLPDPSGLERWRLVGESRLEEAQTQGLRDRAQTASRSGLKITVESVDFTPTLAEREATLAGLRQQIYRDVKAELDRLNAVAAPQKYQARRIDFLADRIAPEPLAKARGAQAVMMAAPAADAGGGFDLAQKAIVRARVVLATHD
jgi:hypothetical protein